MLDNQNNLDLTAKDIALIESALHTQKKILAVQSEAGGSGAHKKMNDLKNLMKRINRNKVRKCRAETQSWSDFARMLFSTRCDQAR